MKVKVLVLLTILVLLVVAGGASAQGPVDQGYSDGNETTRFLPQQEGAAPELITAPAVLCGSWDVCATPWVYRGINTNANGIALRGEATQANGWGVYGLHTNAAGTAAGVYGRTNSAAASARGVLGIVGPAAAGAWSAGVRGINSGAGAARIGVYGSAAGNGWGVYGFAPSGTGVFGHSNSATGVHGVGSGLNSLGVFGLHNNAGGTAAGVFGLTGSAAAGARGVLGIVNSAAAGVWSAGVRGHNNGAGAARIGVWGAAAGNGWGVYGQAAGNGLGVYGRAAANGWGVYGYSPSGRGVYGASTSAIGIYGWTGAATNNWAGFFDGNINVVNDVFKGGGGFRIDHPLDPANKYLYHSFVESPDRMNVYNGNVVLDKNGAAWVELPEWFGAVNGDYRYQLTALDAPGPNLYIAERIRDNRFKIAGGVEGMTVSWLVTGIRQDPYAKANRIAVEEDKPLSERGLYLHPELYGQPEEKGLSLLYAPELPEGVSAPESLLDEHVFGSGLEVLGFEDLSELPLLDEEVPELEGP